MSGFFTCIRYNVEHLPQINIVPTRLYVKVGKSIMCKGVLQQEQGRNGLRLTSINLIFGRWKKTKK